MTARPGPYSDPRMTSGISYREVAVGRAVDFTSSLPPDPGPLPRGEGGYVCRAKGNVCGTRRFAARVKSAEALVAKVCGALRTARPTNAVINASLPRES